MIGQIVIWRYGPSGPSQYPDTKDVMDVVDEIHLSPPGSMFVLYTLAHVDEFSSDQLSQIDADIQRRSLQSRGVYVWKDVGGQWRPLPDGAPQPALYPLPAIFELLREPAGTYFSVVSP